MVWSVECSMEIKFKMEMIIACGYYYQEKHKHIINFEKYQVDI